MRKLSLITLLLGISITIGAEGYQVNLQSNRQTGMGHTGAGQSLGATSIHFNPGAMGMMNSQFDFSAGGSAVLSSNSFEAGGVKEESDNPTGTPFYVYAAGKINDNLVAGIGVTSPFGNSLKWGDDWSGRYLIQDISLQAIFVQPTLSYRITDKLSVGGGLAVVFGGVEMNRAFNLSSINEMFPSVDGKINLQGNTTALGYTAGLFYQISECLSLGISYRSKVEVELEKGDVEYTVPEPFESFFPSDNKFSSMLPMPSNLTFGLSWRANSKWFFAVDLQHVGWSAYESLDFEFEQTDNTSMPKNFENTMIYRFGAEYTLNPSVLLRAGVYYDETPIKDQYLTPETPGTNKTGLSFGFSWFINEGLSVDASILHIMGEERDSTMPMLPGTYNTSAWIPGIGLSYKF
ncbi:OmpP1/FadL family transporter [Natronoflexus pectinivorans]|uniref:Long-chain fatty acid transport protein n=1 Tax=Natronoflexus pectinivorans TaxID=682526 RepID=A0A4V2RWM5_9BACT|nr:outer membrane protein transport protein [Natronoflexus pectinivorans]TCO09150.1 long-chain fatty acid transport protein [Natronoflexus pectinivorans]